MDRICLFKYKLYVIDKTIDELKEIVKNQKGKHKLAAKIALQLIKKKSINKIKTKKGRVDDLLLKQNAIIATQDKALIKKLKNNKKKVIQLKQKKYLTLK